VTDRLTFTQFCSAARQKGALALCLALCTLGLGLSGSAREPKFTTINPTDSTYTLPQDINPAGAIVGVYFDPSNLSHGFLLAPDLTTFTEIDVTGAGTGSNQGTYAGGINPAGTIVGFYIDASNVYHGFVRALDGAITTFDAPGACSSGPSCSYEGTVPESINPAGEITGYYVDAGVVYHGFVRDPRGRIMTFNARQAGTGNGDGTEAYSVNPAGEITGYYIDANNVSHGFLRARDGAITTFDAPDAVTSPYQGTAAYSINPGGVITGAYYGESVVVHGFLRTP
jgi:hypothetical protein